MATPDKDALCVVCGIDPQFYGKRCKECRNQSIREQRGFNAQVDIPRDEPSGTYIPYAGKRSGHFYFCLHCKQERDELNEPMFAGYGPCCQTEDEKDQCDRLHLVYSKGDGKYA